ncbi:TetR/AcrR family transcriptional regulator [Rhodopseudomonas palustris]|uniref:TetR/AcrR family transcriptional regulator n=1 Tax=Rhodopseudomonas palustris TaxID=1076 RepID=UPI000641DA85|nr:TetR/AcrR family transcriptional regulator [Rhodopseudomonas palustris]
MPEKPPRQGTSAARAPRRVRADAQRNLKTLLEAALAVFATAGVDAPVREIAEKAGVGIGTLYRHFPQRSDLIVAVFRNGVDCCADAAATLAQEHPPVEALSRWMQHYVDFIATKRGLAAALYSGNPAYDSLPAYFEQRLVPALKSLLDKAGAAGEVRRDVDPFDLLKAVAQLCNSAPGGDPEHTNRMVALLIDGLRYGAGKETRPGD